MKLGLFVIPAAFLLAFAAITIGCSDDGDTLTLEGYFAEFDAIDADLGARVTELFATFPDEEEFLADEANLPLAKDAFAELPRIFRDARDRLKAIDPPSEVEMEHDDLVDAYEDFVVALQEDSEAVSVAETMAEFDAIQKAYLDVIAGDADMIKWQGG